MSAQSWTMKIYIFIKLRHSVCNTLSEFSVYRPIETSSFKILLNPKDFFHLYHLYINFCIVRNFWEIWCRSFIIKSSSWYQVITERPTFMSACYCCPETSKYPSVFATILGGVLKQSYHILNIQPINFCT